MTRNYPSRLFRNRPGPLRLGEVDPPALDRFSTALRGILDVSFQKRAGSSAEVDFCTAARSK